MLLLSWILFSSTVCTALPSLLKTIVKTATAVSTSTTGPAPQVIPNPPDFIYPGDAPYGFTTAQLSSVLNCPNGQPSSKTKTVLLVHGTGSTGYESWGNGYVPALAAAGYTPCYVTLPMRSSGDVQLTAAYVAYNLHLVSYLSGGNKIAAIGHSQGGPNIQWSLKFFPSTQNATKIFVGLSPDIGPGTTYFRQQCDTAGALGACDAASWQQASNSNFFAALDYKNKAFVKTTLIWTSADEIVTPPQPNAELSGATTIEVQAVCPNQMPDHFDQLINPTTYALALDALANGGTANPSRIPKSACNGYQAPGMTVSIPAIVQAFFGAVVEGTILAMPKLPAEPPVLPYAQISNQ